MDRVQIFDTTLRDGEQSPGATMNVEARRASARQLEQLGVDVIEAGFAASSEGDFDAVRRVAEVVTRPIVLSLARTREQDVDRAIRAVEHAKRPGIHIFIATSDIHLKHKLMMSRAEVIDAAVWAISRAKRYLDYVEFSAEDASRSDPDYLVQVFTAAIEAGARTINVPDTTGYALPEEYGALFRSLRERVPGADRVIWSAHCHNDLGMAVANSLAAVQNGVRQVECTVNGIGERAGNTSMEEVVMAIKTRADRIGVDTGIVTEQIYPTSRLLAQITGIPIPINKPIVGDNAFAHEAGIHQDGVLKNRLNYEIMRPESVGLDSNRLVLGKHSGRHAFVDRLRELGLDLTHVDMNRIFDRFKGLADAKQDVYDEDLIALVAEETVRGRGGGGGAVGAVRMAEEIRARAAGEKSVEPGDNVWVRADVLMTHDVCGPGTIGIFEREFGKQARVWDRDRVVLIPDHYIFTKDDKAHRNVDILREFAREQGLPHLYDVGTPRYKGVCHIALAEEGHTRPGEVLFGTDSHTCTAGAFNEFATGIGNTDAAFVMGTGKLLLKVPPTMHFVFEGEVPPYILAKHLILQVIGDIGVDGATYRAMEFAGEAVLRLSMEERMTLANLVIEAGGKNGIIACDETTRAYLRGRTTKPLMPVENDAGARFLAEKRYDARRLEPTVAKPHSPDNRALARELKDVKLTRAYIGSCTGGKITDFINAARVLKGRRVAVDTFLVPSTTDVSRGLRMETIDGGSLLAIFKDAGCQISLDASCAACLGGPRDTFGRINGPEVCISTTNRNFPGRMGAREGQVYLASPYTLAASAA